MTSAQAEKAVTTSALVVFGIYVYRHLTEGSTAKNNGPSQLMGWGTVPNLGRFITSWGFAFFVMAVMAEAAPGLGGSFAITVAVTDVLGNANQIQKDINTKLSSGPSNQSGSVTLGGSLGGKVTRTPGPAPTGQVAGHAP